MHVTHKALDKIKTRLETTLPDFENRIWRNRRYQLHDRELPAIVIQYDGERVSEAQATRTSRPIQRRDVNFSVVVVDKIFEKTDRGDEGEFLEDYLFEHAAAVETTMLEHQNLEGRDIHSLTLNGVDMSEAKHGERPLSFARLEFTMSLRTRAGQPESFI
ncbi:hypothetical protein M3P21_22115 [Ruegeria sp. 2012CJ41-6]|uniref:Tail terminator n=1 Tax=Ruegeria spongiae TaxID=2942209 RepID=A0ABT0Q8Q2_9RHOB|nr:hypothetical protein [Ruegeria spongiae]MCL6286192.1 hypothetical protein [Ruegeria spongiae]